jgi:predicted nucleotidyltransferase
MIPEIIKDRLPKNLLFLGYRGSQAHGMFVPKNDPNSIDDIDLMGIHFASMNHYLGFGRFKGEDREDYIASFPDEWDIVSYEFRKFVELLANNNPNVLSMLWLEPESILHTSEVWKKLVDNRHLFVSKLAGHSFAGYANSQLQKMTHFNQKAQEELQARAESIRQKGGVVDEETGEAHMPAGASSELMEAVRQYREMSKKYFNGYMGNKRKQAVLRLGYDSKNAAHLIRLLRMAMEFLKTGEMIVKRPDAEELLTIKQGQWQLAHIQAHAQELFVKVNTIRETSTLPEEPDKVAIEKLIVETLESHIVESQEGYTWNEYVEKFTNRCLECKGKGFYRTGIMGTTWERCTACFGTGKRRDRSK